MPRSRYLFVHIISLSLIVACGVCHGKREGTIGPIQLTVVDAATDTDLRRLHTGQKLDVSKLGSSLTLRANPRVKGHKSVVFVLDGKPYRTENLAPYAMAGGSRRDYKAWDLDLGAHTLIVHVYNRNGGKGKRLASRTVSFSLVDSKAAVEAGDMAASEVSDKAGGKEVACNLQQRIEQASAGDIIDGAGCVERSAVELRKRLTLKNLTIKGSDDWSDKFTAADNGNYVSSLTIPVFDEPTVTVDSNNPYLCEVSDEDQLCREAEMVFVNGVYLLQVPDGSDPGPDEFALDHRRHVILGKNPDRAQVEVVVRQGGINLRNGSAGTVLDRVLVTQIGNTTQGGTGPAVHNNGNALTIKNSIVSWVHSTGIGCGGGARCEITGTEVHHAGAAGINSWKANPLVFDNNLIHHNCSSLPDVRYNDSFTCSGLKITGESSGDRTVANSEFHHNDHAGIWLDIDVNNTTIANNRIHHNEERGIEVEISSGVVIRDNVLFANGWVGTPSDAFNSGGIYILDSGNVKIYRNVMACNRDGFAYIGGRRQSWNYGIEMYDNDIIVGAEDPGKQILTGWLLRGDELGSYIAHDNRYYYGGQQDDSRTRKFQWDKRKYTSLAEFSSTPGEENSRWLSSAEASRVLSANDIPMDCL